MYTENDTSGYNNAFASGVILNIVFVAIEAGYGVASGSVALVADAGHNFSDVLSLLLGWIATLLANKAATSKRTYGYRKATIMAPLASAILLFVALGGISWEAIVRFAHPRQIGGTTVIVVATIGVIINTITALLFISGKNHDLNIKGVFLHMAADAGVSLGVVLAGIIMMATGWLWVDPAISLVIVAGILASTWSLLRESVNLSMDAVPEHIDLADIKKYLIGLEEVSIINDLHVWPLSTTEVALTAHLIINKPLLSRDFISGLQKQLHDRFRIDHSTIQVEQKNENTGNNEKSDTATEKAGARMKSTS